MATDDVGDGVGGAGVTMEEPCGEVRAAQVEKQITPTSPHTTVPTRFIPSASTRRSTMMYDQHPVYPHQQHLPWAHEPWKTLYVLQRILSTLILVPCWIVYYTFLPRSYRPRPSWSLAQIVLVKFMKRIYRVTEVAGVTWNTRDPKAEPNGSTLRETRFAWVPPLPEQLHTGIVDDEEVSCQQVGTYIWPKEIPLRVHMRCAERGKLIDTAPSLQNIEHAKLSHPSGTEVEAESSNSRVIGVFLHGGGYCHMSAHEKSGTSRIPRRLMKVSS